LSHEIRGVRADAAARAQQPELIARHADTRAPMNTQRDAILRATRYTVYARGRQRPRLRDMPLYNPDI